MRANTAEDFWAKVGQPNDRGCREWMAGRNRDGYGRFKWKGKEVVASRLALALSKGSEVLPEGDALHTCDNPPCCEPSHLFEGDAADNAHDRDAKGRGASGSRNGAYTKPERVLRGDRHPRRINPERWPSGSGHRWHGDRERVSGENNPRAKLTTEQVRRIRIEAVTTINKTDLARRYGIGRTTLGHILAGRSWAESSAPS